MTQVDQFIQSESKYASLEEVFQKMKRLKNDPLAKAGTNIVLSRGNPHARLMIVGEAPGPEEDRQGKPFVGRSGQLLDKVLQSAGFDPETDVFITNSVFRMPPGTDGQTFRKPTVEEIEYYRPCVFEIIHWVNPLIILLSGNIACQSVLNQTGITSLHGKWLQLQDRWVMPIFHPSYLLRNPSSAPDSPKGQMQEDLRKVRKKYDELIKP
jgi:uracil-DNA glycosylase